MDSKVAAEEYTVNNGPLAKHKLVLVENFESTRFLYSYIPLGDQSPETLPLNPTLFAPVCLNGGGIFYVLQPSLKKPILYGSFYDHGRIRVLTQVMVAKGQKAKKETVEKTLSLLPPLRDSFARRTRQNSAISAIVVHPSLTGRQTLSDHLKPLADTGLLYSVSDGGDESELKSEAIQAVFGIDKLVRELNSLLTCQYLFR